MKRTALALTVFLVLMVSIVLPAPLAKANFIDFPIPSMKIISPPYPPNEYENSTVMLEIHVYMHNNSPRLRNIFYTIDEKPSVYLYNFTTLPLTSWDKERQGYTASAKVDLENLSDGNHTVKAYSVDVNGQEMSTSQSFTVNSHYAVTVLRVLSPTNQTYFTREIPLIFTVNGEFMNASYRFLEPSDPTSAHARVAVAGNTTLTGLSDGFNKIMLTVEAENGMAGALLNFTINTTQTNDLLDFKNPLTSLIVIATATSLVIVGAVIVYERKKIEEARKQPFQ